MKLLWQKPHFLVLKIQNQVSTPIGSIIIRESLIDTSKVDPDQTYNPRHQFALLEFDRPVPVIPNSLIIGSKLDLDVHTSMCRLAFKGSIVDIFTPKNYHDVSLPSIKVFKNKLKEGIVERRYSDNEVIVKNLLKKDTNIQLFVGLKVRLSTGEEGKN